MADEQTSIQKAVPLIVIIGAFLLLGTIYAWATPIFEASDELWHFGMVDYVAENRQLPVQDPDIATQYEQEGSQPPLYYAIAALLVGAIDRSDYETFSQPNPHALVGIPLAVGNKNLVLHNTLHPSPQGTALAVYVLRGFGLLLGSVTIVSVYFTTLTFTESRLTALFAAVLTAFNPMFIFIAASVNNDNLVTALNSLAILGLVTLIKRGFSLKLSVGIAVAVALASLSKLSGNVLVPVIALVALWVAIRDHHWRGFFMLGSLMAGFWAVASAWWYVRNLQLYGELFGTNMMVQVAGARLETFTVQTALNEFEGFRIAYWGLFGGVNILTWTPFYRTMDVVTFIALLGIVIGAFRFTPPIKRHTLIALGSVIVLAFASLIAWTAQTYASQGRLLFPFLAAISPLMAWGIFTLLHLLRLHDKVWFVALLSVTFATFALFVPFVSIVPAYAKPPQLAELPASVLPVYARFDDVELIAYVVDDKRYHADDTVPITVYWRVVQASERDLSLFLTALDSDGDAIGKVDTYPGGGSLRTSQWQPQGIFADRYEIDLDESVDGAFKLRLQVGWWHYPTEDVIQPLDANGSPIDSVILDVGGFVGTISAHPEPEFTVTERDIQFSEAGSHIQLLGYDVENNVVSLHWQATGSLSDDYTVFVQVVPQSGDAIVVGQGDAPPELPTRYWQKGDRFITVHAITLVENFDPQEDTQLLVGWYRPSDFLRLIGSDYEGSVSDNAIRIPVSLSP